MRILAVVAALIPLLTLPAMADRAAVDKCKADADKTIASLNERLRGSHGVDEGNVMQEQHREATRKRAACDNREAIALK